MGALIEGPAFNASLTGEHNLRLIGELHGAGPTEVAEALELVGIAQAARRAYSGYSLGMKQRLGVAGALISGPELLVLDEPMNGLDPEAVRDMRELLKRLRDERGMTVVVSSTSWPRSSWSATGSPSSGTAVSSATPGSPS
ncbi:hypothetical protein SMICM17S_02084 [Streptomyces microflavus]